MTTSRATRTDPSPTGLGRFRLLRFAFAAVLAGFAAPAVAQEAERPETFAFEAEPPFLLDVAQVEVRLSAVLDDTPPRADLSYGPTLAQMAEAWGLARLAPDGERGNLVYDVRRAALSVTEVDNEGGLFSFRFGRPDRKFEAVIDVELTYDGEGPDRRRITTSVLVTGSAEIPRNASLVEVDAIYAEWIADLAQELDRRLSDVTRQNFPTLLD